LFERPQDGERALLVHVDFSKDSDPEDLDEFKELALSAGAEIISIVTSSRAKPDPKYFVGTGKVEEITQIVQAEDIHIILFNHTLSPAQERNLERAFKCRVLDRTGLILDIFAQRARTAEGKLQVELAQLDHMSTRLVRGWTHLERQKGGIGLRGPGETQLETDRRLIRKRIKIINEKLEKVKMHRAQGRRSRQKAMIPTLSLVGYTNAGKSTLFRCLTAAAVYVADQLFATLDPTLRRLELPEYGNTILVDTVGFIRHLPHPLVESFKATLEETLEADLLLHVIDVHSESRVSQMEQVNDVLTQIGAESIPQLLVYNKIDLLENEQPHLEYDAHGQVAKVWISAQTGEGIDLLHQAIAKRLGGDFVLRTLHLQPSQADLRAALYNAGGVLSESIDEEGNFILETRLTKPAFEKIFHR